VFVVYGVDEQEHCQLRRSLRRSELLRFFAQLEPCLIGMEAGSGAHYWARELCSLGHEARIIDPRLVAPYRSQGRTGKNDSNDAAAICEAVGRPQMRFVPIKDPEQQAVLLVHRIRKARVNEQNRLANQLRGFLAEFGIVLPRGLALPKRHWTAMRQQEAERVPSLAWEELDTLYRRLLALHDEILGYDRITKRGDEYLRTLLVHGARSELLHVHRRQDPKSRWAHRLRDRKPWNQAAVALANKHARFAWAILAREE